MIRTDDRKYILENSFLRRELEIGDFGVRTNSFINCKTRGEYLSNPCREFAFSVNRHYVNSIQEARYQAVDGTVLKSEHKLEFLGSSRPDAGAGAEELCLTFRLKEVDVTVHYRIYDRIAGMRKWLTFTAREPEIQIENLVFDDTLLTPGGEVGRDIKVWRDLIPDSSEAALDAEAAYLLAFEKKWMNG